MGNPQVVPVVKIACDVCKGNPHGFYECNADAVPKGAKLYKEKAAAKPAKKEKAE